MPRKRVPENLIFEPKAVPIGLFPKEVRAEISDAKIPIRKKDIGGLMQVRRIVDGEFVEGPDALVHIDLPVAEEALRAAKKEVAADFIAGNIRPANPEEPSMSIFMSEGTVRVPRTGRIVRVEDLV